MPYTTQQLSLACHRAPCCRHPFLLTGSPTRARWQQFTVPRRVSA